MLQKCLVVLERRLYLVASVLQNTQAWQSYCHREATLKSRDENALLNLNKKGVPETFEIFMYFPAAKLFTKTTKARSFNSTGFPAGLSTVLACLQEKFL